MSEHDVISNPAHYDLGDFEAKDVVRAAMGDGGYQRDGEDFGMTPMACFWMGSALKHLLRWRKKNGVVDLRKARQCIDYLLEEVDGPEIGKVQQLGTEGAHE